MTYKLIHGDCLEEMARLLDGCVDMVLTDPPYGTTACRWDSVIQFEPMWAQLKRLTKKNGAIVLTASQPFTSALVMSNVKMFKYCWVWEKSKATGHLNAKRMPMKIHEDVLVFSDGGHQYCPQDLKPYGKTVKRGNNGDNFGKSGTENFQEWTNYPRSILKFPLDSKTTHPTQKPVALMEYLIKTYTNEGDTVLDFTMGSGTTGIACKNLNRSFIGIERDADYFKIAQERIGVTQPTPIWEPML